MYVFIRLDIRSIERAKGIEFVLLIQVSRLATMRKSLNIWMNQNLANIVGCGFFLFRLNKISILRFETKE